jgi:hypothetical protein
MREQNDQRYARVSLRRAVWAMPLGVVGIVGFTGILALAPAARGQVQVLAGQGINFVQADITEGGTVDDSDTGAADINTGLLTSVTGISGGYLNIVNSTGWAVENLPVSSASSAFLNLGTPDGQDDTGTGTSESVYYSATPLDSQPVESDTSFAVSADNESFGGLPPMPGLATFNTPSATARPIFGGTKKSAGVLAGFPNIQAADNQCAPAADANGFTWLKSNFGLNIPSQNNEGRGVVTGGAYPNNGTVNLATFMGNGSEAATANPSNSLVGQMDLAIGRTSTNRVTGNGPPTWTSCLTGVMDYLGLTANDAATVKVNYASMNIGGNAVFANVPAKEAGITPTPINGGVLDASVMSYIYDQIAAGEMVWMAYAGYNPKAKTWTGLSHAVDIIGAQYIDGVPYIDLSSDMAQTDIDLKDNDLGNNQGKFWSTVTDDQKNNDWMKLSNVSGVDNVNTFAYAVGLITVDPVPEPASLGLLAAAMGLAMRRRKR